MNKETKDILVHLICLLNEIDVLDTKKSGLSDDTVSISRREELNITIRVLKDRLKELKQKLLEYPNEKGID